MRIVHACLRYPPSVGGVETYVEQLVKHTRDIPKYDVRVLTSKLRTHHPPTELDPSQLLDDPPYVQRLHHAATPGLAYPRLQALRYYLGHHRPDIIHGFSFWYQPADAAARFARRRGVPFILHPMFYINAVRRKLVWQLYQHTIGRQTFAAANAVVVISPYEQHLIEQHDLPTKRFVLIPPGINSRELARRRDNPLIARGLTGTYVLIVSRLAPGKGLLSAIAVWPKLLKTQPDVHLVIAGEDFGLKVRLQSQISQLHLNDRVHLVGHLPRADLIGAYQHAAVLLHPSFYEAFGITVAEALAAGTPVIARRTGSLPFVAPHAQGALLFESDTEMLDYLQTMLNDRALAYRLAAAGQQRVQQEFTWDSAREKILKLYDELS